MSFRARRRRAESSLHERRHRRGRWSALLSVAVLASASCSTDLPGEVIGAYTVQMRLTENDCGEGVVLLQSVYSAELRADVAPRGYWRVPGFPPQEGRYEEGAFEFLSGQRLGLDRPDAGTSGCTVIREERLTGEVQLSPRDAGTSDAGRADAGASDAGRTDASVTLSPATDAQTDEDSPALEGEHRISFRADPNGRCANNPGPLGPFLKLPCSARYELLGLPRKPF